MDVSSRGWRRFFCDWAPGLPRRGILVTLFGEQIPFSGFLTSETLLLVERQTPDAMGARTVLLEYEQVTALKITEVVKPQTFTSMGFEGTLPKK